MVRTRRGSPLAIRTKSGRKTASEQNVHHVDSRFRLWDSLMLDRSIGDYKFQLALSRRLECNDHRWPRQPKGVSIIWTQIEWQSDCMTGNSVIGAQVIARTSRLLKLVAELGTAGRTMAELVGDSGGSDGEVRALKSVAAVVLATSYIKDSPAYG